jgi:molybdopterin converting factor small subunit
MAEVATKAFQLRTYIEQKESELKKELAERKQTLEKLENWMLARLDAEGMQRMAVNGVGTVFKQKKTSVKVSDWEATLAWLVENKRWDLLNAAVNKTATVQHIEDTGSPPPGVDYTTFYEVGMQKERATE